jgi:predicted nucleic acid-binding protein
VSVVLDTNVLVYASGFGDRWKVEKALDVLEGWLSLPGGILLMQSLSEFANVAFRKYRVPGDAIRRQIEVWSAVHQPVSARDGDLHDALAAVERHRIAFWDAMLWATARRAGAHWLLSEDFQDGRVLDGVTILNPFALTNDPVVGGLFGR